MDEDRIQLKVMGLSYSQFKSGAYALILEEIDGPHRIPIIIGAADAQSIAIRLERIIPLRPNTHDLFVSFAHAFGVKLKEVLIYKFEDGIFSSELTFTDGERTIVIDSRTSDAVAIAMRTQAPIFTTREILDETGFILEDVISEQRDSEQSSDGSDSSDSAAQPLSLDDMTERELEEKLNEAIQEEKYEEAAKISEILKNKRNK